MEKLKPQQLRQLNDEQLSLTLQEQIKDLFDLRCRGAAERQNASGEIRKRKRDIARILTIQRERAIQVKTKTQAETPKMAQPQAPKK